MTLPPNHGTTPEQLDLLASGRFDADAAGLLRDVERTRRLLALRLVLRYVRDHPSATGPLRPVDEAWDLLAAAERVRPAAVAELLARPQVGVWSAHLLRRLRRKDSDTAPLWFHTGQLHALAAAAGLAAELRFSTTIPLWDGIVVLPGIGAARVTDSTGWDHAVLVSDTSGSTVKTGDDAARPLEWRRIRILRGKGGAAAPRVHLDDTGPYRGSAIPERPDPLPESSAARWGEVFADAWALLARDHPHWARELAAGLSVITPRPAAHRFRPHSGSVGDGYGAAVISEPHDATQLAVTMVHEHQHSKLTAIGHLTPLTATDAGATCYAPWRDDPRPVSGLYQGVHAFTAVAEFWARQRELSTGPDAELAHFEFALVRAQVTEALGALRGHPALTDVGRRFADRLARRLAALRDAEVPAGPLAAAEVAVQDHRTAWRAAHLHPMRAHVLECAHRWSRGAPAPGTTPHSPVVAGPTTDKLDSKAILTRVRLAGGAEFEAMRSNPRAEAREVDADLTGADFALVAGEHDRARASYAAELATGPGRPGTWSGYALALHALSPGPASRALLDHPHVVRAVRDELDRRDEAPDVERLAAWLGTAG
ncbi:HEXXH motif domain-containing protein [Saccharothrix lopnurensis]|uniref:HEXXH motif domain-containing protein n=1 Tax=Saccharothrix lopnurensis TaxID=1670621 RepID=UPI0036D33425